MSENITFINKILPRAALPFRRIKGSVSARKHLADKYSLKFYRELNSRCKNNTCSVKDFKKALNKTLYPDRIKYCISREINEDNDGSFYITRKFNAGQNGSYTVNVKGYRILLPLNSKRDTILDKLTAFHEARHLFDYICNPKHSILRKHNLTNTPEYNGIINYISNLFLGDIYKPIKMKNIKTDTETLIKNLPDDMAIGFLQIIRYRLQSEINAYRDELRFLLKDGKLKSGFELSIDMYKYFKFKSKLKFVESLLKNIIRKERESLKKRLPY